MNDRIAVEDWFADCSVSRAGGQAESNAFCCVVI